MFGQPQGSPFGSPPAPAFGQQTNSAPFGSPAPAPAFGSSGGFGGGGFGGGGTTFGSPAPAPTGFGAAPSTGFGQPSTFGAPSPAPAFGGSTFGAPSPAPAFGSSPFGQPAPAPSGGGLFGQQAPAPSGGLFGSSTSTGFGSTGGFGSNAGSTFGSQPSTGFGQQAQTSTFGQQQQPAGLFGQQPAPAPAFGQQPPGGGGLFGATSPAPAFGGGGGGFGSPAPAPGMFGAAPGGGAQGQGTRSVPFAPTSKQDGTSSIQMQSISAMQAYEGKNFEELRYEDYSQGNKGTGTGAAGAPAGFGGFGSSPAPAPGGLFGSPAPAPAFGGGSTFGAPAPAPFGSAGGFGGSPAPAPAFGAPSPAPAFGSSTFGASAPAPAFGGSTFGKPASGSLFGAPAPAPSGGLFGAPAPAPGAFGAPAPAPGGGFGGFGSTPAPAPGGLFGSAPAPAPGGLFGSPTPAPAFGAPAAPAPGGFGGFGSTPAPAAGGLFGSNPAPAPGAFGSAPGGLFGSPAPAPGGLFGGAPASTSLFGSAPAPGGLFGSATPAPAPGGLFGAQQPAPAPGLPPAGSIIPPAANEVLTHQIQALDNKRKEMQKLDVWRGKSPEDSSIVPSSRSEYDGGFSSSALPSTSNYSPYRQSPRSSAKIRPRGFGAVTSPMPKSSSPPLNNIGTGGRPMMSPEAYAASSVKRLVIKPDSLTPKPKMQLRLANSPASGDSKTHALPVPLDTTAPAQNGNSRSPPHGESATIPVYGRNTINESVSPMAQTNGSPGKLMSPTEDITPPPDQSLEYYQQVVGSPDGVPPASKQSPASSQSGQKKRPSYVPKLTKAGYVVSPSLERLAVMSEADLASVSGFSVRHDPYGIIEWEGAVDVRGADLDKIIFIGQSDVSVYGNDEEEGCKPETGSKLNRPARITFYNVFPEDGGRNADEESKEKLAKRIVRSTSKMKSAELISYSKETGEWKIRALHF